MGCAGSVTRTLFTPATWLGWRTFSKIVADDVDEGFEAFVRARSSALLRTAVLLTGDVHHGQDLLQEALWRTHRRWSSASDNPEAYTRKVLVNLRTTATAEQCVGYGRPCLNATTPYPFA